MPTQHPNEPLCESCRFFRQIDMRRNFGECYRYPPRTRWNYEVNLLDDTEHLRPKTNKWDFCGEHQVKTSSG